MARRVAENGAKAAGPALDDFYVCTLSGRTITYKGQLTTAQVFVPSFAGFTAPLSPPTMYR